MIHIVQGLPHDNCIIENNPYSGGSKGKAYNWPPKKVTNEQIHDPPPTLAITADEAKTDAPTQP